MTHSIEYNEKQGQDNIRNISSDELEIVRNNLKTVVLEGSRLRGGHHLFADKVEARRHIIKEINALIDRSYDNYRYKASENSDHIFLCVFNKLTKELLGLMVIVKKNIRGAEYCELGVSLVDSRYRGLGIQTMTAKESQNYAITLIEQGYPLYATTRSFSAHTQYQMYSIRLPNKSGKFVPLAQAHGMAPYYIFEKDEKGDFFLEIHMLFDSWRTLNDVYQMNVYLPPCVLEKSFYIFNPIYRPDVQPVYIYPILEKSGEITLEPVTLDSDGFVYPEIDYKQPEWDSLANMTSIIGHEENANHIKKSASQIFEYSDIESPNSSVRIIQIEKIHSFNLSKDFDSTMKSINVTVQVSEFTDEKVKAANIAFISVLIKEGFVPSAVLDVRYQGTRVRIALFAHWQNIKLQTKFEILKDNRQAFEIFKHDCNVQGYNWPMIVNLLDPELLKEKHNEEGKSAIIINKHLIGLTKNVESCAQSLKSNFINCSLINTPFQSPLEKLIERYHKNPVLEFTNDFEMLEYHFFEYLKKALTHVVELYSQFLEREIECKSFSISLKNVKVKLKLENVN